MSFRVRVVATCVAAVVVATTGCGKEAVRGGSAPSSTIAADQCTEGFFRDGGTTADIAVVFSQGWTDDIVDGFWHQYLELPAIPPKTGVRHPAGVGTVVRGDGMIFMALCKPPLPAGTDIDALVGRMKSAPGVDKVMRNVDMRTVEGNPMAGG